jgi:hypothetical protein
MIVNYELKRKALEEIMACLKYRPNACSEELRKKRETLVRLAGFWAEILNQYLSNTNHSAANLGEKFYEG